MASCAPDAAASRAAVTMADASTWSRWRTVTMSNVPAMPISGIAAVMARIAAVPRRERIFLQSFMGSPRSSLHEQAERGGERRRRVGLGCRAGQGDDDLVARLRERHRR